MLSLLRLERKQNNHDSNPFHLSELTGLGEKATKESDKQTT